MKTKETCKDRIQDALNRSREDIEEYLNTWRQFRYAPYPGARGSALERSGLALCLDAKEEDLGNGKYKVDHYDLTLSWGGPSDGVRFFKDGRIEYYFMDWYDGATFDVSNEILFFKLYKNIKSLRDYNNKKLMTWRAV